MAEFILAHKKAYVHNQEYCNNPNKGQNYFNKILIGSKLGVTPKLFYKHLDRVPTKKDMINLSEEESLIIYKKEYWNTIQGSLIKNQSIALLLYDTIINDGYSFMIKSVRKALISQELKYDGYNVVQINNCNEEDFFYSVLRDRLDKYSIGDDELRKHYIKKLFQLNFTSRKKSRKYLALSLLLIVAILFFLYKQITV